MNGLSQVDVANKPLEPRNGFAPGDYVTCELDEETLKAMQEEQGGWNPNQKAIINSISLVKGQSLIQL